MTKNEVADEIRAGVEQVVSCLVKGDIERALWICQGSRVTAEELTETISRDGRTLIYPSTGMNLDIVQSRQRSPLRWSILVFLWTVEDGGESDLGLEMTAIKEPAGRLCLTIDDMRVL